MVLVYVHIMTKKVGIVKCEILEGSVGDACCRLGWQEMVVDGCLGVLVFVCVCVCVERMKWFVMILWMVEL